MIPKNLTLKQKKVICEFIDKLQEFLNCNGIDNHEVSRNSSELGSLLLKEEWLKDKISDFFTDEKLLDGMRAYLNEYEDGVLPKLGQEIGDNGYYLSELNNKFKQTSDSNWVWKKSTANEKIDELIVEYKIILESQRLLNETLTSYSEIIERWRSKLKYLRLSFDSCQNQFGSEKKLLSILKKVFSGSDLLSKERENFLQELQHSGKKVLKLLSDPYKVFQNSSPKLLEDFNREQIVEIYEKMPNEIFSISVTDYLQIIEETVKKYRNKQGIEKVKKLWKEKTGTDSPRQWSKKYQLPVLAFHNGNDLEQLKEVLRVFETRVSDSTIIDNACIFLEETDICEKLSNADERNRVFNDIILEDYQYLFDNKEKIWKYLLDSPIEPYDWYNNKSINEIIRKYAQHAYNTLVKKRILEVIENMNPEQCKSYLKGQIEKDFDFGIQVLKGVNHG